MNLENLAAIFKQLLLPVLLLVGAVIFTVVGLLNVVSLFSPTPPLPLEFTSSQNVSQTPFYNLTATKNDLDSLKTEAKSYVANFGVKKTSLESLATQLGFAGTATTQKGETIFREKGSRLAFNTQTNLLSYNSPTDGSLPVGFGDEKDLKAKTQKVVEGLNLSNLKIRFTRVTFLKSQLENLGQESLPAAAGQISVLTFKWEKDSLLLVGENSVAFDNRGTLLNFVLYPVTVGEEVKKYPRKSYQDLQKEARAGQFHVTSIEHNEDVEDLTASLSLATFDKIGLALVGQPKEGNVQTVYTLSGTGILGEQALAVEAVTSTIAGVGIRP